MNKGKLERDVSSLKTHIGESNVGRSQDFSLFLSQVLITLLSLFPLFTFGQENIKPLYVIVGEKISVDYFEPDKRDGEIIMDLGFRAKYKVLENFYGEVPADTIEFIAYDHYGIPDFSHHKNVLLYLTSVDSQFYHCKYMYADLYKTKAGNWAGVYSPKDYDHPYNRSTKIKPVKIDWEQPVTFDLSQLEKNQRRSLFPKKYFKIENNTAIAIYGNYIPELFQLKKNGFLKARGYFE